MIVDSEGKEGSLITNGIERDEFYGITTHHITRADYNPYAERPPFLVDGILHHTMTLLYGEAKSGKSTLAAALAAAMANGEPDFLGRKTTTGKPASVGIIAGDFGDDAAYGSQLRGVLNDGAAVRVYGLDRPPGRRVWEGLQLKARENRHSLIIVDNLTSFVNGSLSDDVAVNALYDQLDVFIRDGVAVLVVAHTSEKPGEHGYKSPYPMGSSAIRARARWLWRVQPAKGDVIRLSFSGNYDAPHDIIVAAPRGVPRFDVVSTADADELAQRRAERQRNRDRATLDANAKDARLVVDHCQGMTKADTARWLEANGSSGKQASTYAKELSAGPLSRMLAYQDRRWAMA